MSAGAARAGTWSALLLVAALGAGGLWLSRSRDAPAGTATPPLAEDERIGYLLAPCEQGRQFTQDTSDMTHVLVQKLASGQREPLRQARTELAQLGAAAVPELRRLFDETYPDIWRHDITENVLGVCAVMEGPWGIELGRLGLGHPQETVRMAALDVLEAHGEPSDYDAVQVLIPLASSVQARAELAQALSELDPARFVDEFAQWLEDGSWPGVWTYVAPRAAVIAEGEGARRLARLAPTAPRPLRPYLLAPAASDGDAEALATLRADLVAEDPGLRQRTLQALAGAGLGREAHVVLASDARAELRTAAAGAIAALPASEDTYEWLTAGLADPSDEVRAACMQALVQRGDPAAVAEALELLQGTLAERALGTRILSGNWDANPGAAQRAYDLVVRLFEEQAEGAASVRLSLLQTLAQVPGRRTAEYLMDVGRRASGEMRGLPPFQWCALHSFNAGPEAIAYLRELFATETDPIRRIDLLAAIAIEQSDETRRLLTEVVRAPANPYEQVFVAAELVDLGPASELAPILKRVYLASADPVARPALQCLLWTWYGIP